MPMMMMPASRNSGWALLEQFADRFVDDQPGGEKDQDGLYHAGIVLELPVTVGMFLVRRLPGLLHRIVGDDRGHQVDHRVYPFG